MEPQQVRSRQAVRKKKATLSRMTFCISLFFVFLWCFCLNRHCRKRSRFFGGLGHTVHDPQLPNIHHVRFEYGFGRHDANNFLTVLVRDGSLLDGLQYLGTFTWFFASAILWALAQFETSEISLELFHARIYEYTNVAAYDYNR